MTPTHIAIIILAAVGATLIGMIVAERIARWQQSRKIVDGSLITQRRSFKLHEDEPPDLVAIARARKRRNRKSTPKAAA